MKTVIVAISVFLISLFIGCGGGGGSDNTSNNPSSSSSSSVATLYDYNKDASSLYNLSPKGVNQYADIQSSLEKKRDNTKEFNSILASFISDVYSDSTPTDTFASYAPRGALKSKTITVEDGKIDYSSYLLKGDINFDWLVDDVDLDLLSEALLKDYKGSEYDINADGTVDTKDIIQLLAYVNSEIKYFDFYTTSGDKLEIATRSVDDSKIVSYDGDETQIMVVAKDRNGASGFETGLSDSDDVWYKQRGWVAQNSPKLRAKTVEHSHIEAESFASTPYLLGRKSELNYNGARIPKEMRSSLKDERFSTYLLGWELDIDAGFKDTDMGYAPQKHYTDYYFTYEIGSKKGKKFSFYGLTFETKNFSRNGKTVQIRNGYMSSEDIYISLADKFLAGIIESENQTKDAKGTIIIERIGPDPENMEFAPKKLDADGMFDFENIPYGAYSVDYLDECLCHQELDKEFIFEDDDAEPHYTISLEKVKVTLTLLDGKNRPVANETISLLAKDCVSSDKEKKSFYALSDDEGKVSFDNVPIGDYTVFVGDAQNSIINICDPYVGTLYTETLWNIDIDFTGRFCDYKESVKNVKIAGINDPLKSWSDYGSGAYPFPLPSDNGAGGGITLVDTSYYTDKEYGLILDYYPNGYSSGMFQGYYKGLSLTLENINQYLTDNDRCVGDTQMGDQGAMKTWDIIHTVFNASQTAAFYAKKAFSIHDTGEWINDNDIKGQNPDGFSTLTVTFIPSN